MHSTSPRFHVLAALVVGALVSHTTHAGDVPTPIVFTDGTPAKAADVNSNFTAIKDAVNENNRRLGVVEATSATQAGSISALGTQCASGSVRINAACVARNGNSAATAGYSCYEILRSGNSAGNGIYWIDPVPGGGAPFQVLCDMTTKGGGWTMVFKLINRLSGDPVALWRGAPRNENNTTFLNTAVNADHYLNRVVSTYWNRSGYSFGEARVAFYNNDVLQPQFFTFDTTGSRRENWFALDRLIDSGYTTNPTMASNFFSITGDSTYDRTWFINSSYGGCPADIGWMVVDAGIDVCTWEAPLDIIRILYSGVAGPAAWEGSSAREADVMAVFVR